ncbi:hypothetical protein GSI_04407 [Ganoderma sinense ZZ0214-1]|uniref:Uncharacterized protein n=1 Tax=Ganoderma sinense ZZ0214-1 TaxID=1077348 RepID=A0A2G8S0E2_9APHY|nr:hypothetical protein GSI_10314 [Ganoderma sinense ZZ0214-1]PIL27240.1 hypothetical protein GSI_10384 [Ganoderma sinense ZZ0214-1]PIL33782.1 hypothetical protein GSI_04407 [Ganoderma sinense ZZ0214-1]
MSISSPAATSYSQWRTRSQSSPRYIRFELDHPRVARTIDYGESHYVGSIKGTQPNSQAWVDDFPHTAWLELSAYFARMFKEGVYPPINRDRIFMWAHPHLRDAETTDDVVPRPDWWQLTDDRFWVIILSMGPVEVYLSTGPDDAQARAWTVEKEVAKLWHSMAAGGSMNATMIRNGIAVAECAPERHSFLVEKNPKTYSFNAYVVASL